jgi:SNARE protein
MSSDQPAFTPADEIEEFEDQLAEVLEQIKECLENEVSQLGGLERAEKCSFLRERVQRAKQLVRSIQLEARDLESAGRRSWDIVGF